MTDITYKAIGNVYELEASGHCGYAEYGEDIVCAAVSALMQSLAMWLEKTMPGSVTIDMDEDKGYMRIAASAHHMEHLWTIERAYDMCITGLSAIAEEYPEHVTYREE